MCHVSAKFQAVPILYFNLIGVQ